MPFFKRSLIVSAAMALFALTSNAQQPNLFLLPNTSSPSGAVAGIQVNPFALQTSFAVQPSASFLFYNPSGSKLYSIARSGSDTLLVLDGANTGNVIKRASLSQAEAAMLTPDGRRLLIVANGLYIFDTTNDAQLSFVTDVGATPTDVAVSLDSTRAFVLSPSSNRLTAVDLTTNSVAGASLPIPGVATGVAVGPNGLVYVTAQNRLIEIDGKTLTIRGEIPLNALPGKLVFTADGRNALAVNKTPVTGSSILLFDLATRTLQASIPNFNVIFDSLTVATSNRVYAVSSQTQTLYEITISPLNINTPSFANIGSISNVTAAVASNEVPNARFLFVLTPGSVYRLDLSSLPAAGSGQLATPINPGPLVYSATATTGTAAAILPYNNNQSTAVSAAYLPLIARVTDSTGRPLQGISVTFTTDNLGAQIQGATVQTNASGFAQTTVIAPPTAGTFTVAATAAPGVTALYTLSTGTSSAGGGGANNAALVIASGNGQIATEQFQIVEPFVVQVNDVAGKPLAGQTVNFTLVNGFGTFSTNLNDGSPIANVTCTGNACTATTDADGRARAGFIATAVPPGSSYSQQTIQASTGTATVNFALTTFLNSLFGGGQAAPPVVERIAPLDNLIVGRAGDVVAGAIQVRVVVSSGPQSGQLVPNIALKVRTTSDPGTGPTAVCKTDTGGEPVSDASGIAICNLQLGGKTGATQLDVNIGSALSLGGSRINLQVTPGAPGVITILQGNNQSGDPGARLPLAFLATVTDAFGNVLPGTPVAWQVVTPNSITLANIVSTSDSNGRVSALGTLGSVAGSNTVKVTAGGASATFTFTVNIKISTLNKVSGDTQTALINGPFAQPLVVQVIDERGSPVANQTVAFAVVQGLGSLSSTTGTTDAQGRAQVNATAGNSAGNITVQATLGTLTQTFNLTARLPGPVFTAASVVNTASGQPGLSPCGISTIYGAGIAPGLNGVVTASTLGLVGPLPLILQNVEVLVDGTSTPLYSVANQRGQESVIFQTPCSVAPGSRVNITVRVSGGTTSVGNIQVFRAQPGIFETTDGLGSRNFAVVVRPNGSYVTPANPALRGETLKVAVTGLGITVGATDTGRAGTGGQQVVAPLIVGVNDAGVRIVSTEYAVGMVGVYWVSFEVPIDAATGPYKNLAIAAEGLSGDLVFGNSSLLAAVQ